jgi:hypothetical protein
VASRTVMRMRRQRWVTTADYWAHRDDPQLWEAADQNWKVGIPWHVSMLRQEMAAIGRAAADAYLAAHFCRPI